MNKFCMIARHHPSCQIVYETQFTPCHRNLAIHNPIQGVQLLSVQGTNVSCCQSVRAGQLNTPANLSWTQQFPFLTAGHQLRTVAMHALILI